MVNSRHKGNTGERQVLAIFRDWLGGEWQRRSMGVAGCDLITPDTFPFAPEIKFNVALNVRHFFKPTASLTYWWQQTMEQAEKCNKQPLLVAKAEGTWYVICLFGTLKKDAGRPVLTSRFDEHQVEIRMMDDFKRSYEDSFEHLFKKKAVKKIA